MLAVPTDSVGKALKKATELINPVESKEPFHRVNPNETTGQQTQTPPEPPSKEGKSELLEKLFAYFRTAVYSSHPAKNYAQDERGINVYDTEVGYNSAQFHHGKRKDMELIGECVKYGVLTPTNVKTKTGAATGYIVYGKNCLIFPLKNKVGRITGMYGRSIISNTNSKHFYLKDREGLYPNYPNPKTKRLILTEAVIDAATLKQIPLITKDYEVLACYGTNGFTNEHKAAIKQLNHLEEVVIFFDGDKSGTEAGKRIAAELKQINEELSVSIINTPENEDVNSIAMGHEPEIFTHLISEATFFLLDESLTEKEPEQKCYFII
jgi:5S rRNA maturation endonuclease (ribonuclease M5)